MKANVSKFNDAQFNIVDLEERLEMTVVTAADGDIIVVQKTDLPGDVWEDELDHPSLSWSF